MKRLVLLFLLGLSLSAVAQRKLGLIIAIGQYPENGGWRNLSSLNDIKYIKAALIQNGFSEKDIDTLINQQATKVGMEKALDDLIRKAQPGDIIVFHFSGHGQQIFDDNGDETDGYDEALIPYDAGSYYDPVNYKGDKHFRDDELGDKLNAIRAKIGPRGSLVVVLDACHSGTATRGTEVFQARGTPVPFSKPGYKPDIKVSFASAAEGQESFLGGSAGNMIVFSASSPNQVNFETKDNDNIGVGSLSFAFARALTDLKPGSTYGYLAEKIRAQIQAKFPQQMPMVEGNLNQVVFGGDFIAAESYIALQKWINDTTFSINEGFLNSINKGSKFKIFALNDKQETMPLAEGIITVAGSFQSIGVITKGIQRGEAYKVKMDEENYGEFAAALSFKAIDAKSKQSSAIINQLQNYIKPFQYLSVSDNPDYLFSIKTLKTGEASVEMIDRQDSTRWSATLKKGDTLSNDVKKQMLDNLKMAMRVNYLRNMADGGSLAQNVTVEIIPSVKMELGADLSMKPKDMFNIRIKNNNSYEVFFNLVDLMPNNEVKVLVPYEGKMAQDFAVQAGAEFLIEDVEVDEGTPTGREFMKFIFTRTAMDLRPVLARSATRGAATRGGVENVLDDMFKDSNDKMSTRSAIRSVKIDEVGVITKSFNIRK
jgi:metacaspase-1